MNNYAKWKVYGSVIIVITALSFNFSFAEDPMDLPKIEKQQTKENWVKSNFGKYYHDLENYDYNMSTNTIKMWVKSGLKSKKFEQYEVICELIPNGIIGKYRKVSEKTGSKIIAIESNWKTINKNDIGANICKDSKYN